MSKTRYRWWAYVKNILRAYPDLKQAYKNLTEQNTTTTISGMPHGGGAKRGTEAVALRELPPPQQKELDAVEAAIKDVLKKQNGNETLALAEMVFFKKTHTLTGAALALNISYGTAKIYHRNLIVAVAKNYGLLGE